METIERIRNATFTLTRRGYDRREVDSYLSKLADWLEVGGADQVHGDTIRAELERIGQRTGKILTAAEEAARAMQAEAEQEARQIKEGAHASVEGIRTSADDYARKTREDADVHSRKARQDADAYATKIHDETDGYATRVRTETEKKASEAVSAAEEKAIRMVEEGAARRRQMEKVIADLQSRREAIVKGLEKLSSQLAGAASQGADVAAAADGAEPAAGSGLPTEDVRRQVRESRASTPADGSGSDQPAGSPQAPTRQ